MGHALFFGRTPLTWCSKKQTSLARSSTEAEYCTAASTTAEIMAAHNLLMELGVSLSHTPVLYCDILSATHISSNPVFHSKMKHLSLTFHFIRDEQVQKGTLRVQHVFQKGTLRVQLVSTGDQLADFLTKPLTRPCLDVLLSKIELTYCSSVLRGHIRDKR